MTLRSFPFVKKSAICCCIVGGMVLAGIPLKAQVSAPLFSEPAGFYREKFELVLTAPDPEAKIYYTLDGRIPHKNNAFLYDGPISISTTSPVSAVCIDALDSVSAVVTQTYLYIKDILRQPDSIAGYPMEWGKGARADYGMDSSVCFHPHYASQMEKALLSIPTVCLVTDPEHLFSHSKHPDSVGIYIDTETKSYKDSLGNEQKMERPASIEYYDPASGKAFQLNCGLLLHGGNSRKASNSPKHSFRVSFRKKYGQGKLRFELFEDSTAETRFDHLILRAGYNYTWIKNGSPTLYPQNIIQRTNAQYIIDPFAKRTQLDMGHLATHERFVHLYINGLYWGLYDICEKINDNFIESYLGGKDEDYDVIGDHNETIDGSRELYTEMFNTVKNVGSKPKDENYLKLTSESWLDIENYIDYMLINYYIGNEDWDDNNWRTARSRVRPDKGFIYFVWDAETALTNPEIDKLGLSKGDPVKMLANLKKNDEFRLLFADRIYRHLFNGGALSETATAARYEALAAEIDLAIIAESARWGDYRKTVTGESDVVYTRNEHWLPRKEALLKDYFPSRTGIFFLQLDAAGWWPSVDAPSLSLWGGAYDTIPSVSISTQTKGAQLYYTLDGSDPREAYTSELAPSSHLYTSSVCLEEGTTVLSVRAKKGDEWSALASTRYQVALPKDTGEVSPPDSGMNVCQSLPLAEFQIAASGGYVYYQLPQSGRFSIGFYALDGRKLAELEEQWQEKGRYLMPVSLPKGIYTYRTVLDGTVSTGTIAL